MVETMHWHENRIKKKAKNDFEKDFFKLMNYSVFRKTIKNVRKHRHIKLVTTGKRKNQLASEPNYHTTKYFSEKLMATEMKKKQKEKWISQSILVCQY